VLHPTFNMTATVTGRLSSSDPNTQQLPADVRAQLIMNAFSELGDLNAFMTQTNMRKCFIPSRPENAFLSIDYRQQEIRLFAALSQDPNLLATVMSGQDVHGGVAQSVWGHSEDPWREWAKVVSFGLLYGMKPGTLEFRLNVSKAEADRIMTQYHTAFPRVRPWMIEILAEMDRRGYATYWSGRRYYRDDPMFQYRAVNALVQGGAADMLMAATVALHDWFAAEGIDGQVINFVHDEIDIELPADLLPELTPRIATFMEMPDLLGVPFFTDAKGGPSLGELKRIVDTSRVA
jgi:DNA polymerase-1